MKLINLTPHTVNLPGGNVPPSGQVARVSVGSVKTDDMQFEGFVDTVPLVKPVYGDVVNLPDPAGDTFYIVSTPVQQACPDRTDLLVPFDLQRDDQGRVIGADSLALPAD